MSDTPHPREAPSAEYPKWHYELLARTMGEEAAACTRLLREAGLTALHRAFDTPDDLSAWPAELDGGVDRS